VTLVIAMMSQIHLTGPLQYRLRNASLLSRSVTEISGRRMLRGPRRATWNWSLELATDVLRKYVRSAFEMADLTEARSYLDSIAITPWAPPEVSSTPLVKTDFRADWFIPANRNSPITVLYLHGGGYSFYPKAYSNFIGLLAADLQAPTLALDYRLAPEHPFPAQLEDALCVYRWLVQHECNPANLVIAGDSAGGNLMLASLLALRDSALPMPALAVALSPATDFSEDYPSFFRNAEFDWIEKPMLERWAEWLCREQQRRNPLISPRWADLYGLPPIYIQAGTAELLFDSIKAFANHAKHQGANVVLESWEDMVHDFQLLGPAVPQALTALRRIREVVNSHVQRNRVAHLSQLPCG